MKLLRDFLGLMLGFLALAIASPEYRKALVEILVEAREEAKNER